jgi:transposase-like protein
VAIGEEIAGGGDRQLFLLDRRRGRPTVLKTEVGQRAQRLLDEGKSVPEVGRELGVKFNTIHKAIRQGRLQQRTGGTPLQVAAVSTKSELSETDSLAPIRMRPCARWSESRRRLNWRCPRCGRPGFCATRSNSSG